MSETDTYCRLFERLPDTDASGALFAGTEPWATHYDSTPESGFARRVKSIRPKTAAHRPVKAIDLDALASRLYATAATLIVADEMFLGLLSDETPFRCVMIAAALLAIPSAVLFVAGLAVRSIHFRHSRYTRRSRNAVR